MSEFQNIEGFEFVNAGDFVVSDAPYQFKGWESKIALRLHDERYEKADETVYFITCEGIILYVGEYTYNLKDRWLSKNHVNHHMYDNIENLLITEGKLLSLWLAISPYCETPAHGELNVSKALEQQIMRRHQPEWNTRNKHSEAKEWRARNCVRLDSFIQTTSHC
ncbi:MAG: hypothetical protein V7739_21135 [Motiliproteus sp.]